MMGKGNNEEAMFVIGRNLRRVRKQHDCTLGEFSEMLNITPEFLGLVERGRRKFSFDNILNFMRTFDVKFEELLGEDYFKTVNKTTADEQITCLTALLSENEKDKLIKVLKLFVADAN